MFQYLPATNPDPTAAGAAVVAVPIGADTDASAARNAELKKLAREEEQQRAERAAMEEAKAAEKKRLALEVAAQRRAVELAEIKLAAKNKEAARQQALQNLDGGGSTSKTPTTPGSALSASSRRILLSPMQKNQQKKECH